MTASGPECVKTLERISDRGFGGPFSGLAAEQGYDVASSA